MKLLSLFKNSTPNNPHLLLTGGDEFLNDYLADAYIHADRFKTLDLVTIDCESDGLDELIASLTEASLFAKRKLLVVKHPFFLTAKVPKKYQSQLAQLQKILAELDQLDDVLVLVASYEKLDRRKKLVKTLMRQMNVVTPNVRSYEVAATLKGIMTAEGYQIDARALQVLVTRSDQVLDVALGNYRKLKLAATTSKITLELVEQQVDLSLDQNVFEIFTKVFAKQYDEAVLRLDDQLRYGSNPIQLIAVFENQIELLLLVKILNQRGQNEAQIIQKLKVHPFRIKLALRNHLSVEYLAKLLAGAIELEYRYKSGVYRSAEFLKAFMLNV